MRNDRPDHAQAPGTLRSVAKALELLLLLRDQTELRVTDVSRELGVAPSTAHRLLATLSQSGFVRRDARTRAYHPGSVLVEIALASFANLDMRIIARPHIARLSAHLHETIHLSVLEGADVRVIDGVEGDQPVRVSLRIGALLPAHSSAAGKVLLAELSDAGIRALYPHGLEAVTDATVTDMPDLRHQLRTVRAAGFASNMGENEVGLHAVAVPIRTGSSRTCAALVAALPASRLSPREIPSLVRELSASAAVTSAQLQDHRVPANAAGV